MSTNLKLAQERICVEKVKESDSKELFEIRQYPRNSKRYEKLKAAFLTKKLWPKGATIKIAFLESGDNVPRTSLSQIEGSRNDKGQPLQMDPLQTSITPENKDEKGLPTIEGVKKIVNERIQPIAGLNLVFVDNIEESTIRISFDPNGGAWSLLGTDCEDKQFKGKATMNLGWFDVATTIHEFGHALGMIHEHQNPRGNLIQWNVPKVLKWASVTQGWDPETTRHNIIDRYNSDEINGSEFDPNSIMLYFFPGSLTLNDKGTHQNLRLSQDDVLYINKIYPNSKDTPSEFLQNIYGKKISNNSSVSNFLKNLFIFILIVGIVYYFYIQHKKKQENILIESTFKMAYEHGL